MDKYRGLRTVSYHIRNVAVALPRSVDQQRTACVLRPSNVDPQLTRSVHCNSGNRNGSTPQSRPHLSLTRQFSTAVLVRSLFAIPLNRRNALLTAVNGTNGADYVSDGCRRSFNRKAKHGSKKKKRKKKNPALGPALPLQKKLTLQERLALEDEQARQRLLYRKSNTPPPPGATGESRKYRKNLEKERLHDEAKWMRILSACDYWFSDVNLRKDAALRDILKRYHGYVPIKVFLSFPKFHYWTNGPLLVHAFKSAEDRYKVRFDPNLWRPPFPPDYVKPDTDWPIMPEEEDAASSVNLEETMKDTRAIEDEAGEDDDWDVSGGDSDDTDHEFDPDADDDYDDEDFSGDEERSEDDNDNSEDEEYSDDDEYSDDEFEDRGLALRAPADSQSESDTDGDEDGFDDGEGTGWFDELELTKKDGHREEEEAHEFYDPGLSDDSEDEKTMRKRNAMWSNDNTYHVYNAFVRHRRVNLEYINSLEQQISECEQRSGTYDVYEDEQKAG